MINYLSLAIKIKYFQNGIENFSVGGGGELEGEKCMLAKGLSVKGSSQQSQTAGTKGKRERPLLSGGGPLIYGVCEQYYTSVL